MLKVLLKALQASQIGRGEGKQGARVQVSDVPNMVVGGYVGGWLLQGVGRTCAVYATWEPGVRV